MEIKKSFKSKKEQIFNGHSSLEIIEYHSIHNKEYAMFRAEAKGKILNFDIPLDCLESVGHSRSIGDFLIPGKGILPEDGYKIVVRGDNVQQLYVNNVLIYDRAKDGF